MKPLHNPKPLPFAMTWERDLLEYEGPLLTQFRITYLGETEPSPNESLLAIWCDKDDVRNRWLLLKVSLLSMDDYLSRKKSLLALVRESGFHGLWDLADGGDENSLFEEIENGRVPDKYRPKSNSFYPGSHSIV